MRLLALGLSLSSAWGNGHATTYRALLRGFAARRHAVEFLERERPWYAANRGLAHPDFCKLAFYRELADLAQHRTAIATADAVLIGSFVPDGRVVIEQVLGWARGPVCFYDIDTPITLAALRAGTCAYLDPMQITRFAAYFSFTGGPTLKRLEQTWGAQRAQALYCCVDPERYQPDRGNYRWDLSYLGTFSPDRQPALERLLLQPARARPDLRFVVAGPQYPASIVWPANVERIEHLAPTDHSAFYNASRFTLNLTRAEMRAAGWSPSVRLFEAAACACPVLTDRWAGLHAVFAPGVEIAPVAVANAVLRRLDAPTAVGARIGERARARALREHTGAVRAQTLERALDLARSGAALA